MPPKRSFHDLSVRSNRIFQRTGPGGRSSNSGLTAAVFGATGMLGRNIVNNLGKTGANLITPYRGTDDERRFLRVMADLGKMAQLRFDLRDEQSLAECIKHADIVYNCIGRAFETKNFKFDDVHVKGPKLMAKIAREEGVQRFVHVSALGADIESPSEFLRSKAMGELAVKEEFPDAVIVRPGHMYGYEDRFWNKMGWLAKWLPFSVIPVPNGGTAVLRPVFVGDVAHVLSQLAKHVDIVGETIELYGPKEYTLHSLIELFQDASMNQHHTIPVPKAILKPICQLWSALLAFPIYSADEVVRYTINDKITPKALTFDNFELAPHTAEELVHRFAQLYRPGDFSDAPFEALKKDYSLKKVQ